MFNVIVCVKSVPGVITKVAVSPDGKLEAGISALHMNDTDEYALEEALAIKRRYGGLVTAITVGPASADQMLYGAVAKGADNVVRIEAEPPDADTTSRLLAEAIKPLKFGLVLTGIESSDTLAAQVGVAVAERLGLPFVFAATKIEIAPESTNVKVTRELGGGDQEVLEVPLPALLAIQTGSQSLTYVPYAKLIQARRKGIQRLPGAPVAAVKTWQYLDMVKPKGRRSAQMLSGSARDMATAVMTKIEEVL